MRRIALVTGGNRGIGFESCRQLAKTGFKVILSARNSEKGNEAADKLRNEDLNVDFVKLDVASDDSVSNAKKHIIDNYGRVDVLLNNAGIYLDSDRHDDLHKVDSKEFEKTMQVNLIGTFRVTRAFLDIMLEQNYGRIINMSSGYGKMDSTMEGQKGAYKISKHGVNAITRIIADEVSTTDIKINAMDPGWTRTDMGGESANRTPDIAAQTVVWLATLASSDRGAPSCCPLVS